MEDYNIEVIRKKYQFVPRTLVFIEKDQHFLMLDKTKKDSYGYRKLNGVGGHIEKGEEPFEAARREVEEESGIKVKNLELAAILFIDINETPGVQVFVFKADYANGNIKESEEGSLAWMTREDILKNDRTVKDLPLLLDIVDKHRENAPPVMIKYLYDDQGQLRIDY